MAEGGYEQKRFDWKYEVVSFLHNGKIKGVIVTTQDVDNYYNLSLKVYGEEETKALKSSQRKVYPLWQCCKDNMIAFVSALLKMGANPDHVNKDGRSCLRVAFASGYIQVVEILLQKVSTFLTDMEMERVISTIRNTEIESDVRRCYTMIRATREEREKEFDSRAANLMKDTKKEKIKCPDKRTPLPKKRRDKQKKKITQDLPPTTNDDKVQSVKRNPAPVSDNEDNNDEQWTQVKQNTRPKTSERCSPKEQPKEGILQDDQNITRQPIPATYQHLNPTAPECIPTDSVRMSDNFAENYAPEFIPADPVRMRYNFTENYAPEFIPADPVRMRYNFAENYAPEFIPADPVRMRYNFAENYAPEFIPADPVRMRYNFAENYAPEFIPADPVRMRYNFAENYAQEFFLPYPENYIYVDEEQVYNINHHRQADFRIGGLEREFSEFRHGVNCRLDAVESRLDTVETTVNKIHATSAEMLGILLDMKVTQERAEGLRLCASNQGLDRNRRGGQMPRWYINDDSPEPGEEKETQTEKSQEGSEAPQEDRHK